MKVAFLSEVNKSWSRKLLTHLELSLSERSENSRFTRCSHSPFFKFILPSSFHVNSNKALFALNVQTAPACESKETLGAILLCHSRATKARGRDLAPP